MTRAGRGKSYYAKVVVITAMTRLVFGYEFLMQYQ